MVHVPTNSRVWKRPPERTGNRESGRSGSRSAPRCLKAMRAARAPTEFDRAAAPAARSPVHGVATGWKSPVHPRRRVVIRGGFGLTVNRSNQRGFKGALARHRRTNGGGARHNRLSLFDGQRSLRSNSVLDWSHDQSSVTRRIPSGCCIFVNPFPGHRGLRRPGRPGVLHGAVRRLGQRHRPHRVRGRRSNDPRSRALGRR